MDSRRSCRPERFATARARRQRFATARARRPASRGASLAACALAVFAAVAAAGCGEGSSGSARVAQATKAATTATTPTTATKATSPASTSTAVKAPASAPSHTTSTPATTPTTPTTTSPKSSATAPKPVAKLLKALGFGKITLASSAFSAGGPIATRYTCDGEGVSPPLQWHGAPQGAAELFLLAVNFGGGPSATVQWAVAIPPGASEIPAGSLPAGAVAGVNSAGKTGWGGVCGSKGTLQRVTFLLYALRHKLGVSSGFNPAQARAALKGDTLASGFTLATYQRP